MASVVRNDPVDVESLVEAGVVVYTGRSVDLSVLNPQQLEAVLHNDGPMLVLAGAGSGKTRVITFRIARLIEDGVKAENILAVTFTNKAAKEMRERVGHLVGRGQRKGLTVSTFHALGYRMLRDSADAVGLDPKFSIFDGGEQLGTIKRIFRDLKIDDRKFDAKKVLAGISKLKNAGVHHEDAPVKEGDDYSLMIKEAYARYQAVLKREQAVDFDDLLLKPVRALTEHDGVRAFYRQQFRYILVDEYQDTNGIQFQLLTNLCPPTGNMCAVGDDDQSIYAFRGADVQHILNFGKAYPGKEVALTQNYRSTGNILGAANAVIGKNTNRKVKSLWTSFGQGDPVEVRAFEDDEAEAKFVADTILRTVSEKGRKHDEFAVLYRSNVQSRVIEEALRFEQIPYRVVGGQDYFERKEVKDALAYLRIVDNPEDELSLRRVINYPGRGIGEVGVEKIVARARERGVTMYHVLDDLPEEIKAGPRKALGDLKAMLDDMREKMRAAPDRKTLASLAGELIKDLGLKDCIYEENENLAVAARKIDNLEAICSALERFGEKDEEPVEASLTNFLSSVTLDMAEPDDSEDKDKPKNTVTLITIHGAKGLEWPFVFMVGMEEELLPHKRSVESIDEGDLSEERRLCYVGITRARQYLYLSHATGRKKYGKVVPRTPSRFLEELGDTVQRMSGGASNLNDEQKDALADDFFAKMRQKLGY